MPHSTTRIDDKKLLSRRAMTSIRSYGTHPDVSPMRSLTSICTDSSSQKAHEPLSSSLSTGCFLNSVLAFGSRVCLRIEAGSDLLVDGWTELSDCSWGRLRGCFPKHSSTRERTQRTLSSLNVKVCAVDIDYEFLLQALTSVSWRFRWRFHHLRVRTVRIVV